MSHRVSSIHTKMAFDAFSGSELCIDASSLQKNIIREIKNSELSALSGIRVFDHFGFGIRCANSKIDDFGFGCPAHFAIRFVRSLCVAENGLTERSSRLKLNPCVGLPASLSNLRIAC